MKRVLCGLVIALMMTGSGYADSTNEDCSFLKESAERHVWSAKNYRKGTILEADRQAKEGINNINAYKPFMDNELNAIKKAHYYAVTYSALCD